MSVFLKAKRGDVADIVVVGGDPERVEALAGMLSNPTLINKNRGFLTYTGKFNSKRITVAFHGICQPSIAILLEELVEFGAKSIIRFGTCGALDRAMIQQKRRD